MKEVQKERRWDSVVLVGEEESVSCTSVAPTSEDTIR